MTMIELETRGPVRILHLRAGENRFNRTTVDAIGAALDEVVATDGPVAVVTLGDGKFFSNGLDLDWMSADGADDGAFLDDVHRMLGRVLGLDVFTVAAINGHAFAGGAMLATAHDHRIMREDRGYWCLPEADLGLPLTPAMHAVLDAHLPRAVLADAALTGRRSSNPGGSSGKTLRPRASTAVACSSGPSPWRAATSTCGLDHLACWQRSGRRPDNGDGRAHAPSRRRLGEARRSWWPHLRNVPLQAREPQSPHVRLGRIQDRDCPAHRLDYL